MKNFKMFLLFFLIFNIINNSSIYGQSEELYGLKSSEIIETLKIRTENQKKMDNDLYLLIKGYDKEISRGLTNNLAIAKIKKRTDITLDANERIKIFLRLNPGAEINGVQEFIEMNNGYIKKSHIGRNNCYEIVAFLKITKLLAICDFQSVGYIELPTPGFTKNVTSHGDAQLKAIDARTFLIHMEMI